MIAKTTITTLLALMAGVAAAQQGGGAPAGGTAPFTVMGAWSGVAVATALRNQYENDRQSHFISYMPVYGDLVPRQLVSQRCQVGIVLDMLVSEAAKTPIDRYQKAPLGQSAYYFNSTDGSASSAADRLFVAADLTALTTAASNSTATATIASLLCSPGYETENRQFTQTTCSTLGSCGVDKQAATCLGFGYQSLVNSNSTPSMAAADWEKKLALMTQDGHSSPGWIGFYTTTHPGNTTLSGTDDKYGELYEWDNDLSFMAQSGAEVKSLSNTNNVAIVSNISGTGSLNLADLSFVALPSCAGYDAPAPCSLPYGSGSGALSSAQALAQQGVDVVLSWHGTTHKGNVLFVEYFLLRAYKLSPEGKYLNVDEALKAAWEDLMQDLVASITKGHQPFNISGVRNDLRISGNKGEPYARRTYLYPPRYGDKKQNM